MIFIWSTEGGPLQYVGLAFFLIQFIPYFVPAMETLSTTTIVATAISSAAIVGSLYSRQARDFLSQWASQMRRLLPQNTFFWVVIGFLVTWILLALVLFLLPNDSLMPFVFQFLFVGMILRSFLKEMLNNAQRGDEQEAESKQSKLSEIVQVVQTMPIEEFAPEEGMDKCTISQLKEMLEIRGKTIVCVERQELVDAIKKCRNYCDTCCICCEEYQEGDPLRILPKCRHEFHVECMDQWAYSFANKSKRKRDPSCPLCNQALT